LIEPALQIGDQIIHMLDANRQADERTETI
jgi:hypothetical protein